MSDSSNDKIAAPTRETSAVEYHLYSECKTVKTLKAVLELKQGQLSRTVKDNPM